MNLPDRPSTRRVVLPSGRTIEVVHFDDPPASATPASGLHVCPCCASEAVQPVDWREVGPEQWALELRCPNCEWDGGGIFDHRLVERLEDELDRGLDALIRDLRRLQQANMEDELTRFVSALAADAILPEDF